MKSKGIIAGIVLLVLAAGVAWTALGGAAGPQAFVEIKEKMFLAQTNDVYINSDDYLGKLLKFEGIYDAYFDDYTQSEFRYVFRRGPGCCGADGQAGFEVVLNGDDPSYPEPNSWVEAVGTLESYDDDGGPYLRVRLASLKVLDQRGLEFVTQ
jgi:uncharacterized membrane protein YcgQ (UPF0703/DUF1980 family)